MNSKTVRLLCVFVAWWFLLPHVMQYGSIWESQANPTENVTVVMRDKQEFTGTLSRAWDKSMVLDLPNGRRLNFSDDDHLSMSFVPKAPGTSFFAPWRSLLVFTVFNVALLFLGGLIPIIKRERRPQAS
jgi:hypothetical protein